MTRIPGEHFDLVIESDDEGTTFYVMEKGKDPGIDTPETFWPAPNDPQQIRTALREALDSWTFYEAMR